jgi:hypothetical protein
MAVHETAEEEIIHATARRLLEHCEATIRMRLAEEKKAKETLAELERLDVSSPEFQTKFEALQGDVLAPSPRLVAMTVPPWSSVRVLTIERPIPRPPRTAGEVSQVERIHRPPPGFTGRPRP